jgi:hypothetical protein
MTKEEYLIARGWMSGLRQREETGVNDFWLGVVSAWIGLLSVELARYLWTKARK